MFRIARQVYARALDPTTPISAAPRSGVAVTSATALSPRSCVLRRRDDITLEVAEVRPDGTISPDPWPLELPVADDGAGFDAALVCRTIVEGHRQKLG